MKILGLISCICLITTMILPSPNTTMASLNLISSNYDKDCWDVKEINLSVPSDIPEEWIPLRASSEHLPIDVSWDEEDKKIKIFCHNLSKVSRDKQYPSDKLPAEMIIIDGVTYCSPRLLSSFLGNRSFLYNNELYYFAGENVESQLIKANSDNNNTFRNVILTVLYEIKLKLPDEYNFIRSHLTGEIICISKEDVPIQFSNANAYIYYARKPPVCYIVERRISNDILAGTISHEAFHVWQYKNGGMDRINEEEAWEYGIKIENILN